MSEQKKQLSKTSPRDGDASEWAMQEVREFFLRLHWDCHAHCDERNKIALILDQVARES